MNSCCVFHTQMQRWWYEHRKSDNILSRAGSLPVGSVIMINGEYFMITPWDRQENVVNLINLGTGYPDTINFYTEATLVQCTLKVNV